MPTEVTVIPQLRRVYRDTYANLPTAGLREGDLGYATDRKVFYRWSGSAWEYLTQYHGFGLAAAIPTAADLPDGSTYFETDTALLKQVQTAAWVTLPGGWIAQSPYTAGDFLTGQSILESSQFSSAPLIKRFELVVVRGGTIRILFTLSATAGTPQGQIYRNGVAVGTLQSGAGVKTEDIAGWAAGDLCELYAGNVALPENLTVSNLRLHTG